MAGNVKLMQLACKFISKTGNPASVCCRLGRIFFISIDFFVFLQRKTAKMKKRLSCRPLPFPDGHAKNPDIKNFFLNLKTFTCLFDRNVI